MADGQQEKAKTDVGGIADMLATTALARTPAPNTTDDNQPDGGIEEADDDLSTPETDDEDDDGNTTPEDDNEGDDLDDEADDEGDDDQDEEDEDEGDEEPDEEVTYDDNDLIEVVVDGETREVSLRDLKSAYSGEGAIDKRLKEATEARKQAQTLRDQFVAEHEQQRTRLLQTVQALDGALFAPMVDKPDPALRSKNMNAYLMQKDAYEEDQKRIQTSRQQLAQFMQAQMQEQVNERQKYRAEQQKTLAERLPELRDPAKGRAVQQEIALAAEYYGFTPQQVAEVDNHAVFLMARDAGRYIKMQQLKEKARKAPAGGNGKRKPRKLKSGGPTTAKSEARQKAQQKQQTAERAAKSGKVDDVAAMLSANTRTRGKQNGRRR
jgi:hypothetical protein